MLGEVTDHGVSRGPACDAFSNLLMLPSIKICPAAEPFAGPCCGVLCRLVALPQKMTCWSPWKACPPWGWFGAASTGWIGSSLWVRLSVSLLMCAKDVANASEGVLDLRASMPLLTIRCHLAVTLNLNFTLASVHILIFTGGILLLVGGFGFTACFLAVISDLGLGRA